ncbi:CHAT domain-containing tetratricopeptide repeat protein [uncultured Gimesia sp.]|uniref:CHAT domain-containing tetratricopeptide repeat protein n=1 Tax=uncultured Gimesia sp. TaxID=1678688 RepID=UPI0030DAC86B
MPASHNFSAMGVGVLALLFSLCAWFASPGVALQPELLKAQQPDQPLVAPRPAITSDTSAAKQRRKLLTRMEAVWLEGNLTEAIALAKKVYQLEQQIYGSRSDEAAWRLRDLANYSLENNQAAAAFQYANQSLKIVNSLHQPESWKTEDALRFQQTLTAISDLPLTKRMKFLNAERDFQNGLLKNDYRAALEANRLRAGVLLELLGDRHLSVIEALLRSQELLIVMNDPSSSVTQIQRLDQLIPQVTKSPHPVHGYLHKVWADQALYTGATEPADDHFRKSVEIYEQSDTDFLPDYAITLNNYGLLLMQTGRYAEAHDALKKACHLLRNRVGLINSQTRLLEYNLVSLEQYLSQQALLEHNWETSQSYLENSLATLKQIEADTGKSQHQIRDIEWELKVLRRCRKMNQDSLQDMDRCLVLQKQIDTKKNAGEGNAALELSREYRRLIQKLFGEDTPSAIRADFQVAKHMQGRDVKLTHYKLLLKPMSTVLGDDHPTYAELLIEIADWTEPASAQTLEQAETAIGVYEQNSWHQTWEYAHALRIVGRIRNTLRHDNAIDALLKAEGVLKALRLTSGIEYLITMNELLFYYRNTGQLIEAIPYCEIAEKLARQLLNADRGLAAQTCNQVATIYETLGRTDEALQNYLRAVNIFDELASPPTRGHLITLKNVAGLYRKQQQYVSAEDFFRRFLKMVETPGLYDRGLQVDAVLTLTSMYQEQERYDEARSLLDQLDGTLQQDQKISPLWCDIRLAQISLEQRDENPHKAVKLFEVLWNVLDKGTYSPKSTSMLKDGPSPVLKLERPQIFKAREWLRFLQQVKGIARQFSDPEPHLRVLSVIRDHARELAQSEPWHLADAENELREARKLAGLSSEARKKLKEAKDLESQALDESESEATADRISLLERVLATRTEILGLKHRDIATTCLELAKLQRKAGRISSALESYRKSVRIRVDLLGDQHADSAEAKSEAALGALAAGEAQQAKQWLNEAIKTQTDILGENAPALAESYHRLVKYHSYQGQYAEALELAQSTCQRFEAVFGKMSLKNAEALKTLSAIYSALGNDMQAIYPLLESMEIVNGLGVDPRAETEFILAAGWQLLQFPLSHPPLQEVVDELVEKLKSTDPDSKAYANALELRGMLSFNQKKYVEAEKYFQNSLQIYKKFYQNPSHPQISELLHNLGAVALNRGDLKHAEQYLEKANSSRINRSGALTELQFLIFYNLAEVKARLGKTADALEFLKRCFEIDERSLMSNLVLRPEAALTKLLNNRFNLYSLLVTLQLSGQLPESSVSEVFSRFLGRKGLALDIACQMTAAQNALIHDENIASKLQEIQQLRIWLAELSVTGVEVEEQQLADDGMKFVPNRQTKTVLRIQELQEQVALAIRGAGLQLQLTGVDVEQIRGKLAPRSALIEFVVSGLIDLKDPASRVGDDPHLLAFFLPSDTTRACRLVDLGRMKDINDQIEKLRGHIERVPRSLRFMSEEELESQYQELSSSLYRQLLQPFDAELSNLENLVIAPDGQLHFIPFAALNRANGHYLVEDLAISYVSSGRDLLRENAAPGRGTLVLADPDYDATRKERITTAKSLGIDLSPNLSLALRGAGQMELRSLRWRPLPGAREEAESVQTQLKDSIYGPVQVFYGGDAAEEVFKTVVSPRIIHLATHGFYLPHETAGAFNESRSVKRSSGSALGRLRYVDNPLMRSGLVLAGANQLATNSEERTVDLEDGWLTAQEISSMNFRNTELVVLSACESGLGDSELGHGVRGLQRAFLVAGAHSLLMSMFEVPDKETRELMGLFYQHFVQTGDQVKSMQFAQQKLILQRRTQSGSAHPFFWASFFIVGQPEATPVGK